MKKSTWPHWSNNRVPLICGHAQTADQFVFPSAKPTKKERFINSFILFVCARNSIDWCGDETCGNRAYMMTTLFYFLSCRSHNAKKQDQTLANPACTFQNARFIKRRIKKVQFVSLSFYIVGGENCVGRLIKSTPPSAPVTNRRMSFFPFWSF